MDFKLQISLCFVLLQKAVMDLTNIAVAKMRKDKGGSGGTIVNISSMAGWRLMETV